MDICPLVLISDAIVQPIRKGGNKDCSLSVNYRGIALASCLSKVIELCILELYGQHLLSSQLQFGDLLPMLQQVT